MTELNNKTKRIEEKRKELEDLLGITLEDWDDSKVEDKYYELFLID